MSLGWFVVCGVFFLKGLRVTPFGLLSPFPSNIPYVSLCNNTSCD